MAIFRGLSLRLVSTLMVANLLSACVPGPEAREPVQVRPPVFVPAKPVRPVQPMINRQDVAPAAMAQTIRSLWINFNGKVGIAVARMDGSWMIEHRGGEMMPQQSVSKFWVALTLLDAVDAGRINLNESVTVRKSDLTVFHQPIAALVDDDGYQTTLASLLNRAMTQSDNTANDFLLRRAGGPDAVRAFISANGLGAIRFGPGEKYLQAGTAGLIWKSDYSVGRAFQAARAKLTLEERQAAFERYLADPVDGAAPVAVVRALLQLKRGDLLRPDSTRLLLSLMANSTTGKSRLRGGVPLGWGFAHKTGTGQDLNGTTAGYNDIGIMTAPDGTVYGVAVMISRSAQPIPSRQMLMQSVAAAIAVHHQK